MTDDFKDLMGELGDVQPIKAKQKVSLDKNLPADKESIQVRRDAAVTEKIVDRNDLSGGISSSADGEIFRVDPLAILEFKRDGVQHGVYKNLRLGKYAIEARLDLHHQTVEQARRLVFQFISDCRDNDIRCALITHGKGEGRENPAMLKSCVNHWLPQLDAVLAFHSAMKFHGGMGATYVLIRKSEEKRLENMERHAKRRI